MFKSILKTSILAGTFLFFVTGCTVSRNSDPIAKEYDKVQTTKQHLEVAADMQKKCNYSKYIRINNSIFSGSNATK